MLYFRLVRGTRRALQADAQFKAGCERSCPGHPHSGTDRQLAPEPERELLGTVERQLDRAARDRVLHLAAVFEEADTGTLCRFPLDRSVCSLRQADAEAGRAMQQGVVVRMYMEKRADVRRREAHANLA